ncbi:hypothetical protein D3C79_823840 [compost metagenome]
MYQFRAGNVDLAEHLLEQHRAWQQRELPVLRIAAQGQLEIPLQATAIALQHGEEQTVLLGTGAFARQHLPNTAVTSGNAFGGDAVVLLQGRFQQP